ncbi:RimJ/RimL family protein N-acetyltransferase [Streptosporangium becharense]|uniref:RimJ/RimL family protein N-acetyltransferase n=1 Tax=Streptosporangium becharense TaxID=1816182 RepID=A0A7W9MHY5_9ACTN|nr:GNAT family protein [Streptosporangium becharense]MBB2914665.1 RimJ/RimL family protein N-acetyltransferase [Streptosporangium becharense]MBB5820934.1 RimJ/RimL family protein N-acetyltransferase [Streptosporangium becharense]
MTDETGRGTRPADGPKRVSFAALPGTALAALLDDDLRTAGEVAGVALPEYFLDDESQWLWRLRSGQMADDPGHERWIAPQAVTGCEGVVIGYAGFHGPPDGAGMVEVGYWVAPEFRRRGYGRAILAEMLRRAGAEPAVRTVRASISPGNAASLATIAGFGFVEVGEQWDEEDGLELIFEVPVGPRTDGGAGPA